MSPAGAGFLLKVILRMRPVFAERRGRDPLPAVAGYTGKIGFACKSGARRKKNRCWKLETKLMKIKVELAIGVV